LLFAGCTPQFMGDLYQLKAAILAALTGFGINIPQSVECKPWEWIFKHALIIL